MSDARYEYTGTGGLTQHTCDSVRSFIGRDNYPWIVEVKNTGVPYAAWKLWLENTVKPETRGGDGCMGEPTTNTYHPYGTISKDGADSRFLCFRRQEDRAAYIRDFPTTIINPEPFKTVV